MKYLLILILALSVCCSDSSQNSENGFESEQSAPKQGDWVIIGIDGSPATLNPANYLDESAENISHHLFGRLLDRSSEPPFDLVPQVATGRPLISDDGLRYTFTINPKASWDDHKPVLAEDVEFSVKVYLIPYVDCANKRHFFESLHSFEWDESNTRSFTFVLKNKYMLAESAFGSDLVLMRASEYDPSGILNNISVIQLTSESTFPADVDNRLRLFAEQFNSSKYANNPKYIKGCGPYQLVEWKDQKQVVLKRKGNWWGDSLGNSIPSLQAWPDKLVYRIFSDPQSAVAALKQNEIDVYNFIPPQQYSELKKDEAFLEHYKITESPSFTYTYFGMNQKPTAKQIPFFVDRRVRQAMAHLVPVDDIIDKMLNGLARRIIGPVFPMHAGMYNDTLKPIPFDLEKAKRLLDASDWVDSNGDGIRDHIINGKSIPFRFEFLIPAGNEMRKNIVLLFQESCRKVGVEVIITPLEFTTYIERQMDHNYDMYYGGWAFSPAPLDLKQIFHTSNWSNRGSNDVGFGNQQTDRMLGEMRTAIDTAKRNDLYRQFQEIVYQEQPYVFLLNQYSATAIHKRFRNSQTSALRPNFQANSFWTPVEHIKYGKK